jgi:hypothetical protein
LSCSSCVGLVLPVGGKEPTIETAFSNADMS